MIGGLLEEAKSSKYVISECTLDWWPLSRPYEILHRGHGSIEVKRAQTAVLGLSLHDRQPAVEYLCGGTREANDLHPGANPLVWMHFARVLENPAIIRNNPESRGNQFLLPAGD